MDKIEAKKPTRIFGLSRNVISMGVVSFLNDLSSDMIFPFIPIFLTTVLGAGPIFVGLVEGLADATASLSKVLSGRISDKVKRRKPFMIFGYSLSAVAKPLLALATAPWHVLGIRFIDRVGKGVREAPRDALLSLSCEPKDVGRAFGFHKAADTLGAAFGPLAAFVLLPFIGNNLRTLFLFSFVASFFSIIILKIFVHGVSNGDDSFSKEDVTAAFADEKKQRFHIRSLGLPFMVFLSVSTVMSLGKASEAFLLLRAQELGVAIALLPVIYFMYNITYALASTPAGILSDKIGHRNTFMIGMAIYSLTYLLIAESNSLYALWILFAVYGCYSAFTEGVGRAIIADLVDEKSRATAYGVYNAATGLALLPASIIFGILWEWYGSRSAFYYGSIMGIAAFFIFLVLRLWNHYRGSDLKKTNTGV